MAIAISVAPAQQGRRLSSRMIQTFTDKPEQPASPWA
jgi:hypothetical protein